VVCPHCGAVHLPADKRALQAAGHWVADPAATGASIASFWLLGCAAAFQPWHSLVRNYLLGLRALEQSGQEEALRTTTNVDQGVPYQPRSMRSSRSAEQLQARAEWWPVREVPEGVRYLHAVTDVQGNRFVCQVIGRGVDGERWLVDRFQITESPARRDLDGRPQPLDPAAYLEDWVALEPLASATYPLADGSGRRMRVRLVGVDSGGRGGPQGESSVTGRAYDFWRAMRRRRIGDRFRLLKGHPGGDGKPVVWRTFPDSKALARSASARGDVPVHWVNTIAIKDALDIDLRRDAPGPGYVHLPEWAEEEVFAELCAEVRGPKRWDKTGRNEAWDLFVYEMALDQIAAWDAGGWKSPRPVNWESPPAWARQMDQGNALVVDGASAQSPSAAAKRRRPRSTGLGSSDWCL
jgi:phage terminase large subunit GpA-like protein